VKADWNIREEVAQMALQFIGRMSLLQADGGG
jgi:hypothetical protein